MNGRRPAHFRSSGGKLHIALAAPLPARAALSIAVRYGDHAAAGPNRLGRGRFRGAVQWCAGRRPAERGGVVVPRDDDHPSAKASYRIQISTDSPYRALANGELVSRQVRAGHTVWTYEQPELTSTYLITLQIGMYETPRWPRRRCRCAPCCRIGWWSDFDHDFGRQPQMMKLFVKLFGPYRWPTEVHRRGHRRRSRDSP